MVEGRRHSHKPFWLEVEPEGIGVEIDLRVGVTGCAADFKAAENVNIGSNSRVCLLTCVLGVDYIWVLENLLDHH